MYIPRSCDPELEQWAFSNKHKPLLLRGARQVGKSASVRHLAEKFEYFIELNFDESPSLKNIFENSLSAKVLCENIQASINIPIIAGKTLLFFDEIQACVPAISSLRYFYEQIPELHLIAAGSLLEFVLDEVPSYGVGRIRSLFMYPFSFNEFLMAHNEVMLFEILQKANHTKPMSSILHTKLISYFKKFLITGGMPEVVCEYVKSGNLLAAQRVIDDLVISIEADFVKYKKKIPSGSIREVFNSIIKQNGGKFSYSYPNASLTNLQIKEIIGLLIMAGLVYSVTHTSANGIPLGAETNLKSRKYLLFDTGILQRILGLNIGELLLEKDFNAINKGAIAEQSVGLELIKNHSPYNLQELYYWQRDAKNSQAEIDFVIQKQQEVIPIEVKAGTKGSMQSMYLFLKEKQLPYGIRISLENFSEIEQIKIFPLYAIGHILK